MLLIVGAMIFAAVAAACAVEAGDEDATGQEVGTFACNYGSGWSTWVHYYNAAGRSGGCSSWEINNNYCAWPSAVGGGRVAMRSQKYSNNYWTTNGSSNTGEQSNNLCNANPDYWHLTTFNGIGGVHSWDEQNCAGHMIARSQLRIRSC
jgi:hypothetical protein